MNLIKYLKEIKNEKIDLSAFSSNGKELVYNIFGDVFKQTIAGKTKIQIRYELEKEDLPKIISLFTQYGITIYNINSRRECSCADCDDLVWGKLNISWEDPEVIKRRDLL